MTMVATQQVRIMVAGSVALVRAGICSAFTTDPGFNIAAEVAWLREVPEAYRRVLPDVTLIGLGHSEVSGTGEPGVLRQILESNPYASVIALADSDGIQDLFRAVHDGAKGALLLDTPVELLREAVRDVLAGECVLDLRLTRHLFDHVASLPVLETQETKDATSPRHPLSGRELEVLREMSKGLRNKEIAAQLGISTGTVKTHVASIFGKLRVNDRTAAAVSAIQKRLLDVA